MQRVKSVPKGDHRRPLQCTAFSKLPRVSADDAGPTAPRAPASGFSWPVRVYYEDTDAGGVVFYANYLKFFERCRTEWLRSFGIDQKVLADREGLLFAVAEVRVQYLKPARLDDPLMIEAAIEHLGRSSLVFLQRARRGEEVLAQATVRIVCIDRRWRPARLPRELTERLHGEAEGSRAA